MAGIWENYLLLRIGNSIFLLLALSAFLSIIVKLFKNAFINNCNSECLWKNIVMYFCGIAVVYISGVCLISAIANGYAIMTLEASQKAIVDGAPNKEIFIDQIKGSFQYTVSKLVQSGVFYFLYTRIVKAINIEIEKLKEKVVRWDFKNKF